MEMPDVDKLLEMASQVSGLTDFGEPHILHALDALTRAFTRDAELEPARVMRTTLQLVNVLVTRAQMTALLQWHPEILEIPIEAPVFITGLPRTGTTLLHNLMAAHPSFRAWKLWEMRAPIRPPDAEEAWEEERKLESAQLLELLYDMVPEFARIHPMRADWPDECSWLFRHSFASMVYPLTYRIPSYLEWLTETDMTPYYQDFKVQLQILRWRQPEGRLVLKDPSHLWHLNALLEVFPDAKVIHLHRSALEALPSLASLCHAMHRVESTHTDSRRLAPYCLDMVDRAMLPLDAVRRTAPAGTFIDQPYRALVADPLGTVGRLCAAVGAPFGEAEARPLAAWLAENRQHKAGRHDYTPEQFGFDRERLRLRFMRYHEQFLPGELV